MEVLGWDFSWAAVLTGCGALLAGIGSFLTGLAAIRRSKKEGKEEAINN